MHVRVLGLAFLVGITLVSQPARAGSWAQDVGHCYAKLWERVIAGNGAYLSTGLRDSRAAFEYFDIQTNLYAECGVHEQITVMVAATPFGYAAAGYPLAGRDTFYVGPLGAGVRFDPIGDHQATRFAIELEYAYAPPVGAAVLAQEPGTSPPVFYRPALESHSGELSLELGHGYELGPDVTGWVSGSLGARLPSGVGMTPAVVAFVQAGMTFSRWLTIDIHFPLYEPFGQPVAETNVSGVGQTRYLGFGLAASAWLTQELAITAAVEGVFYASSNAATPSLILGVESRLQPVAP